MWLSAEKVHPALGCSSTDCLNYLAFDIRFIYYGVSRAGITTDSAVST